MEHDVRVAFQPRPNLGGVLAAAFQRRDSPEEIREQYYIRHQGDVAAYLSERERAGAEVRAKIEERFPAEGLRARLLARQQ